MFIRMLCRRITLYTSISPPHILLRHGGMLRIAEGGNGGWKIKMIIFVGVTSGSVNVQIFNDNLEELQVLESKRNAI